ncbi:MAG TPA: GyrI-like domain-containing protein [Bacillota bacterium]|nr:GyrI-like domain-containing protein [Bacillota bacterium]
MDYEIVNLEAKTVAGITIRTSNQDPGMSKAIGGLWQRFFTEGVYQAIPGKANVKSIGLYTNYENGVNGAYDVMVCCEVKTGAKLPDGVQSQIIPAGRYAKFVVNGHMPKALAEFWAKLWGMDLDRKFDCDFEEYQSGDPNNAEVHIYISLR